MQGKQPSGEGSAHLTQPWGEGCSPGCKRALFLSPPAVEDWADLVSTAGGDTKTKLVATFGLLTRLLGTLAQIFCDPWLVKKSLRETTSYLLRA